MDYIQNIAAEFVLSLDQKNELVTAFESLAEVVSAMDFDSISYTLIPLSLGSNLSPVFLSSKDFSANFLIHYEQAGFEQHDFTIRRALTGGSDFLHWQRELELGELSSAERDVVLVACHDYGLVNAVTIPVQQTPDIIAGFSITSASNRSHFDQQLESHNDLLSRLCVHFHRYVHQQHRRHFYQPALDNFSLNERCMIDLVSRGKRLKQAKDLYGISQGLAGKTLHKLFKKCSVSDQGQLGYLIGRHRLVELLDIEADSPS